MMAAGFQSVPPSQQCIKSCRSFYENRTNDERTRATMMNAPTLLSISRKSSLMTFYIINQTRHIDAAHRHYVAPAGAIFLRLCTMAVCRRDSCAMAMGAWMPMMGCNAVTE